MAEKCLQSSEDKKLERKENAERDVWENKAESVLSLIGFTVSLGNMWRFPYLCMRNGGGAFLIPYFTFVILCGIPLFFMELCIGQFSSLSPLSSWGMCPLFKGVGWAMVAVSSICSIYYNTIMAWALYFLGMCLRKDVPWRGCDNEWNTPNCTEIGANFGNNSMNPNGSVAKYLGGKVSSAEEFWNNKVLDLSDGIGSIGTIKWDLALSLLAAWVLVFLCISKSIKSSGKVVYVTALLPYILLTVLLVRGATLPGSLVGIKYYVIPEWHRLRDFKVWTDACLQVFYSFGAAWGCIVTNASYNTFHNNCLRDALVVCCTCAGSSLFAGFAIFSILGYMAHSTGQNIQDVVTQGPGLAFIAYPEAISQLPVSTLWAILFFLTILTLGLDGQFGMVETLISSIVDEYPQHIRKKRTLFVFAVCGLMFLTSLPFVTRGGMYLFQILDWYSSAYAVMVIGLCECVAISYCYGIGRFYHDITLMLKKKPSIIWAVCWCGITPLILVGMLVVSALRMVDVTYGDYEYPSWAIGLGWCLAMISIVPIPVLAVYRIARAKGSIKTKIASLLRPDSKWGPQQEEFKLDYKYATNRLTWSQRMNISAVPSIIDYNNLSNGDMNLKENVLL